LTKLIRQKLIADCGICCMAMLTGVPYRSVFATIPFETLEDILCGLRFPQLVTTLRRLEYPIRWHWPERFNPDNIGEPLREKVRGKTAIHLVQSLSKGEEGCYHYVLVDNGMIFDPAPPGKPKYRDYDRLYPLAVAYRP
jgi:hypothetical protein